jgi:hypothetical protein
MLIVAIQEEPPPPPVLGRQIDLRDEVTFTNTWLLCVGCGTGAVADSYGQVSPPAKEFPTPDGTPPAEKKIWEEVRECLSIHAYNAVAMLCRKILLHLVFTHERSQNPQATPRDINFAQAVQYLLDNQVITPATEPFATAIKKDRKPGKPRASRPYRGRGPKYRGVYVLPVSDRV